MSRSAIANIQDKLDNLNTSTIEATAAASTGDMATLTVSLFLILHVLGITRIPFLSFSRLPLQYWVRKVTVTVLKLGDLHAEHW